LKEKKGGKSPQFDHPFLGARLLPRKRGKGGGGRKRGKRGRKEGVTGAALPLLAVKVERVKKGKGGGEKKKAIGQSGCGSASSFQRDMGLAQKKGGKGAKKEKKRKREGNTGKRWPRRPFPSDHHDCRGRGENERETSGKERKKKGERACFTPTMNPRKERGKTPEKKRGKGGGVLRSASSHIHPHREGEKGEEKKKKKKGARFSQA